MSSEAIFGLIRQWRTVIIPLITNGSENELLELWMFYSCDQTVGLNKTQWQGDTNKSLVFAENIFTIFNAQNHLQKSRCFLEVPAWKMLSTAVNLAPEDQMSVRMFFALVSNIFLSTGNKTLKLSHTVTALKVSKWNNHILKTKGL